MVSGEPLFMRGAIGVSFGMVDGTFECVVLEDVLEGKALWYGTSVGGSFAGYGEERASDVV